jgi:hypothetical protein
MTIVTAGFTGTQQYHRITIAYPKILATDGVLYVAQEGGAFWLMDAIASHQHTPNVRREEFQVWRLNVAPDKTAVLTGTDGNENEIARQEIECSDFPDSFVEIWLTDNVLLLPSEY